MVRWNETEPELRRQRRASAVGDAQGRGGNRRGGRKPDQGNPERWGGRRSRRETAVDESKKDMADRVARHQAHYELEHAYTTRVTNWCIWFERGLPLYF